MYTAIEIIIFSCIIVFCFFAVRIFLLQKKIQERERVIIGLYKEKIDKIPAFIEIMRKYTPYNDIFLELTHLHKIAIISNVTSIYDLLEGNSRIHREFLFLMKVSAKVRDLHRDGNFLYIRDFIIFYESGITKELLFLNRDMERYNSLLQKKNFTLIGLLFPWRKYEGI